MTNIIIPILIVAGLFVHAFIKEIKDDLEVPASCLQLRFMDSGRNLFPPA